MPAGWGEGKQRKQLLKQARRISDEEIVQFLDGLGLPLSRFYLSKEQGFLQFRIWDPHCPDMELTIDDAALSLAITLYLERHNYPCVATPC